jgi:hypothetical protein
VATFLNPDTVPNVTRPNGVDKAVRQSLELRERAAAARDAAQAAAHALEQQEADDLERQAAAVKAGKPIGQPGDALGKAKTAVETTRRDAAVSARAAELADAEVEQAIRHDADSWLAALDAEADTARERAIALLDELQTATGRIAAAGSARLWLTAALADARFDRPQRTVGDAHYALSSRRRTANSQPLTAGELYAFVAELLEPAAA